MLAPLPHQQSLDLFQPLYWVYSAGLAGRLRRFTIPCKLFHLPYYLRISFARNKKRVSQNDKTNQQKSCYVYLGMFLMSKLSQTDVIIGTQTYLLLHCIFGFDGFCVIDKVMLMWDD